jgi:hypothetical protein
MSASRSERSFGNVSNLNIQTCYAAPNAKILDTTGIKRKMHVVVSVFIPRRNLLIRKFLGPAITVDYGARTGLV